jgi:hypothetical protein
MSTPIFKDSWLHLQTFPDSFKQVRVQIRDARRRNFGLVFCSRGRRLWIASVWPNQGVEQTVAFGARRLTPTTTRRTDGLAAPKAAKASD